MFIGSMVGEIVTLLLYSGVMERSVCRSRFVRMTCEHAWRQVLSSSFIGRKRSCWYLLFNGIRFVFPSMSQKVSYYDYIAEHQHLDK